MIKPIREWKVNTIETIDDITTNIKRLKPFQKDFKHRFISLLSFDFIDLHFLEPNITTSTTNNDSDHSNSQPAIKYIANRIISK
jgi:hypothetical protein